MVFARFVAVVFLLQGIGPALLFGAWRPGGLFLLFLAAIYVVLFLGLWQGRRWALPSAFALTLPQLFILSSSWFSWRFYVLASYGFGLAPAPTFMQMPAFGHHSLGGCLDLAFGHNQHLIADYAYSGQQSFVLFNFVPLPFLLLLLLHLGLRLAAADSSPVPNHAIKRIEAGGGAASDLRA